MAKSRVQEIKSPGVATSDRRLVATRGCRRVMTSGDDRLALQLAPGRLQLAT